MRSFSGSPVEEAGRFSPAGYCRYRIRGTGTVEFVEHGQRVNREAVRMRVVAFPSVLSIPISLRSNNAGSGDAEPVEYSLEPLAGELPPEVATQPPLVGVVPIAAVENRTGSADTALGERTGSG